MANENEQVVQPDVQNLPELVKEYFKHDQEEKRANKYKKPLNDQIKKAMREGGVGELIVDDIVATFKVQQRTSMNEQRLLDKLKELGLTQAIQTVERPDPGMLEKLIYDGELDASDLASCSDTTEVAVLSVKQKKKAPTTFSKKRKAD